MIWPFAERICRVQITPMIWWFGIVQIKLSNWFHNLQSTIWQFVRTNSTFFMQIGKHIFGDKKRFEIWQFAEQTHRQRILDCLQPWFLNTGFLLILAVAGVYYSYICGTFWQNELTTNDNKWLLFKHSIIWWPFYDQVSTFMMPHESCGWPWQESWRPVDDSDNNRWRPVDDPWWWHQQIL